MQKFQSTQPEWAATLPDYRARVIQGDFNPSSPNGLRHNYVFVDIDGEVISIHAARMGCDEGFVCYVTPQKISIHAARMGCDIILHQQ